jgi:protocatechuate 3,4-dioxygenase beta subunit
MTAALWLFLWLLGTQSSSASAIQGVVVRAGTDQPIPDEIVGLWPTNRVAKTDQNGRFLFREVAPGDYRLTVIHDGIRQQVPLAITAAQRFESISLQVKQAPAITGTVFDPNGERVAAARVQAFRTVYSVRGPQMQSVMSVPTDDLGEFRLFRLRPGQYYVSASLSDRDQRIAAAGLRPTCRSLMTVFLPSTLVEGTALIHLSLSGWPRTQMQQVCRSS